MKNTLSPLKIVNSKRSKNHQTEIIEGIETLNDAYRMHKYGDISEAGKAYCLQVMSTIAQYLKAQHELMQQVSNGSNNFNF